MAARTPSSSLAAAFTTDFLRWLVRDDRRSRSKRPIIVCRPCRRMQQGSVTGAYCAKAPGLTSVVYDMNGLGIEPDWIGEIVHDLPGGEWRRVQRAKGYRSIIVNGVETFAEDKCTGATPASCCATGVRSNRPL